MARCATNLSIQLDSLFLERSRGRRGSSVASPITELARLPIRSGSEVASELGGRFLLRYLRANQVDSIEAGLFDWSRPQFTTPTPIPPREATALLRMPRSRNPATHALVIDPARVPHIQGPRYVALGRMTIEYMLPDGIPQEALVLRWPIQVD